ncbi:MAG: hypothetical protein NTU44_00050 [Bacteroidetes bacterium]|nr:hypothetical protein [Bacteroidota bacterium]
MNVNKIKLALYLVLSVQFQGVAQHVESVKALPALLKDIKISYPNSNPFKKALHPVPETAIFKMEGYYLWDPSVIKVGDT